MLRRLQRSFAVTVAGPLALRLAHDRASSTVVTRVVARRLERWFPNARVTESTSTSRRFGESLARAKVRTPHTAIGADDHVVEPGRAVGTTGRRRRAGHSMTAEVLEAGGRAWLQPEEVGEAPVEDTLSALRHVEDPRCERASPSGSGTPRGGTRPNARRELGLQPYRPYGMVDGCHDGHHASLGEETRERGSSKRLVT